MLLFKIGFLTLNWVDILDILIVAILLFQMYRLIKGSLAFNIFIGFAIIYFLWLLVRFTGMELLAKMLNQFINVGVIALLIVFQPEIRKFLLYLGKGGNINNKNFFLKLFSKDSALDTLLDEAIAEILIALENLKLKKNGALIVFSESSRLQLIANTGVQVNSDISAKLIESIFEKNTPLHDGAVIISGFKITAAGCVLPVSDNSEQANRLGLRHRAAIGITEVSDTITLVVSEEKGTISYTHNGRLIHDISIEQTKVLLKKFLARAD